MSGEVERIHCVVCGYEIQEKSVEKCPRCSAPAALFERKADMPSGDRKSGCECSICGYVCKEDTPPRRCPQCGVAGELFELRNADRLKDWICTVCGLRVCACAAPSKCPKCGCPGDMFKRDRSVSHMVCSICGLELEGETPPDRCPQCGVSGELFEKK